MLLWWLIACGRDDILVEADARGAQAGVAQPGQPAAAQPGQPIGAQPASGAGGVPGVPAQPSPGVASPGSPGVPGAVTPGVPSEPTPGVAAPTTAGVPDAPAPGIPVAPKPAPPGTPQPSSGPQVALSGTIDFNAWTAGHVRITVFDGDHSRPSATPPRVLGMAEVARPGPFTVSVPLGAGKVYIEGSVDEDADGRPGPQEPQGKADRYPVTVGSDPVSDLVVTLDRRAAPPTGEKRDDY